MSRVSQRLLVPVVLWAATAAALIAVPQLDFKLPPGFTINQNVNTVATKDTTLLEIPVSGETVDHWSQLITIQDFNPKKYPSPAEAVSVFRKSMLQRCPSIAWSEIESAKDDILVEWSWLDCPGNPDQVEIFRFFKTKTTLYRVSYTSRKVDFSAEQRANWVAWLKSLTAGSDNRK